MKLTRESPMNEEVAIRSERCVESARAVARLLEAGQEKLVLAESCTGGLVAATLTQVPGISNWFCGSAVIYRETTKQQWLDVPEELLRRYSAESQEASDSLAVAVLEKTPEATVAAAITGHLGPNAPVNDGAIFISVVRRTGNGVAETDVTRFATVLESKGRVVRQVEAAGEVLASLITVLE